MKKFFVRVLAFFLILLHCVAQLSVVYGCGMALVGNSSPVGYDYGQDSAEHSFISYKDGVEDLILTRQFEATQQGMAWIIPIPAEPQSIQLDALEEMPRLSGSNIIDLTKNTLDDIQDYSSLSQIWTFPFFLLSRGFVGASNPAPIGTYGAAGFGGIGARAPRSDVEVYSSLTKSGITSQVITAQTTQGLYGYLRDRNLNAKEGSLDVLESYVGGKFSFVSSWIDPSAALNGSYKGVHVTFPAKEIFYPLKPGSRVAGPGLPETIYVAGFVKPKLYADIKHKTEVSYFSSSSPDFLTVPGEPIYNYTKIVINARPSLLTEDLYISSSQPLLLYFSSFVTSEPIIAGILLLILISMIAGVITGTIVYTWPVVKKNYRMFLFTGGMNVFSILGVVFVLRSFMKTRRLLFVILYSLIYLLSMAVFVLFTKSLL